MNKWVEAMLSFGRSSDELHEQIVTERQKREDEIKRAGGGEQEYEDARSAARREHAEIECAVTWIERQQREGEIIVSFCKTIYDLMQHVRAHPDFVFGTVFTKDDFPDGVPDDFPAKQGDELLAETGNLLIESEGG